MTTVVLAPVFGWPIGTVSNQVLQVRAYQHLHTVFSDNKSPVPTPLTVMCLVQYAKQMSEPVDVLIVAAPPHLPRVRRDLEEIAKREGVKLGNITHDDYPFTYNPAFWFSKKSTQWWTRNRYVWWVYDTVVRAIPFDLYLKLAAKELDPNTRGASIFKRTRSIFKLSS